MKKIIMIILALVLMTSASFADDYFGDWKRYTIKGIGIRPDIHLDGKETTVVIFTVNEKLHLPCPIQPGKEFKANQIVVDPTDFDKERMIYAGLLAAKVSNSQVNLQLKFCQNGYPICTGFNIRK